MKMAIVKFSEIAAHGRMDAQFHIAVAEVRARVEQLRARYSDEEATALVNAMPFAAKQGLRSLLRGERRLDVTTAAAAAAEYPHIALALVENDLEPTIALIQREIDKKAELVEDLLAISQSLKA